MASNASHSQCNERLLDRDEHVYTFPPPGQFRIERERALCANNHDGMIARLYQQLLDSPRHGPFIRQIEAIDQSLVATGANDNVLVGVVPGAFYREKPFTGADGQRLLRLVEQCGYRAERVPLPSLGTMRANALQLDAWIADHSKDMIVLISLSKGSADVLTALTNPFSAARYARVVAWISLSGILQGSPIVNWLQSRPLRHWAVRVWTWWQGYDFRAITELARTETRLIAHSEHLPTSLKIAHVVGLPRIADLSCPLARRVVRRAAKLGPNDGGGIVLTDVLSWPGLIYPAYGADHYLQPRWEFRSLIARLLAWATTNETDNVDAPVNGDSGAPCLDGALSRGCI